MVNLMSTAVILDESHYKTVAERSRAAGKTPEQYLQALIDADDRSIDDILAPVRAGFESMSDGDLDDLMARAKNDQS